ncbi:hypothetical protein Hanom_Chr15g01373801 [Helianthus anomalus]
MGSHKTPIFDDLSDDEDVDVIDFIILEQDSLMKDAKIIALEDQMEDKDMRIKQLEGDVTMLISLVYDLKGKLEKKFGEEFADEGDKEIYEQR